MNLIKGRCFDLTELFLIQVVYGVRVELLVDISLLCSFQQSVVFLLNVDFQPRNILRLRHHLECVLVPAVYD